jgi:hypothetical protein
MGVLAANVSTAVLAANVNSTVLVAAVGLAIAVLSADSRRTSRGRSG